MDETPKAISAATEAREERKRRSFWADLFIRLVKEKPLGTVGGIIVLLLFLAGIFADLIAPYGYNEMVLADRLSPPSGAHILGADNLGRDLLSRIIYGARVSLYVGLGANTLSYFFGTIIGTLSAYLGGKTDLIIQRVVDAWMSFPFLLIVLSIISIIGPGLWQIILVLGCVGAFGSSRVVRSAVIGIRSNMYMDAARAIGATDMRIMGRHILPNIMVVVITGYTVRIGGMILMESTLSFLGFGIPPPVPSWGGMLSGPGRQFMLVAPWMALWPGLALALVVYGFNMFGDAVRDLMDPRLRGGLGRFSGVEEKRTKMAEKAGVTSQTSQ